jgi:hypothetical protein
MEKELCTDAAERHFDFRLGILLKKNFISF